MTGKPHPLPVTMTLDKRHIPKTSTDGFSERKKARSVKDGSEEYD